MDNILKQRLIGALILIALGVVFWPIIFVEPDSAEGLAGARMPAPPAVNTTPIEPPDRAGLRTGRELTIQAQAKEREQAIEEDVVVAAKPVVTEPEVAAVEKPVAKVAPEPIKHTRSEAPVKPAMDSEGVPIAWILQVVSVSVKVNAETVRDKLISAGHKAYVKPVRRGDKTLYRVYIGPKFERAKLESVQPKVDNQFSVKSMVVRYVP
ncbi:MAG: SPOR domain-containing protein [Halioglobus sp.]